MTRRHLRPIRPPATLLSDDEILAVLLQLLYRTGRLELAEMAAAICAAELTAARRSQVVPIWALRSVAPSGVA